MVSDGDYTAVLDRFEHRDTAEEDTEEATELAVLLLERDGDLVDQLVVKTTALPKDARHQDAVLQVRVEGEKLLNVTYEAETTERRAEHAQARFDRLSRRPPNDNHSE